MGREQSEQPAVDRLVAGGQVELEVATPTAVVISPDGPVPTVGPLRRARFKHTILPWVDCTVLVIGGTSDDRTLLRTTEIYDPRSASFRPGPRLVSARYKLDGSAVRLSGGRVVVAGVGPGAEVLDPARAAGTRLAQEPDGVACTARSAWSASSCGSSAATTTGSA